MLPLPAPTRDFNGSGCSLEAFTTSMNLCPASSVLLVEVMTWSTRVRADWVLGQHPASRAGLESSMSGNAHKGLCQPEVIHLQGRCPANTDSGDSSGPKA